MGEEKNSDRKSGAAQVSSTNWSSLWINHKNTWLYYSSVTTYVVIPKGLMRLHIWYTRYYKYRFWKQLNLQFI
jgi:hypothetical protein